MRRSLLALAAAAFLGLAAPARAGITFNSLDGLPNSSLGSTKAFSSLENPLYKVTAQGSGDLFIKTQGGDETGLGLKATPNNEITKTTSIDFNFAALKAQIGIRAITFNIGSVGSGEGFQLSGVDGSSHILFQAVNATTCTVAASDVANYDHFVVTAFGGAGSNVLVNTITVSGAVPEPASVALTAMGFAAALAGYRPKRRKATSA